MDSYCESDSPFLPGYQHEGIYDDNESEKKNR